MVLECDFSHQTEPEQPLYHGAVCWSSACVMAWQGRDVLVVCLVRPQVSQHNRQVLEHNNILQTD